MGPEPVSSGKLAATTLLDAGGDLLQWSRSQSAPENYFVALNEAKEDWLQWGRSQSTPENLMATNWKS